MHLADLPIHDLRDPSMTEADLRALQSEHWLARSEMGYVVLRHADATAMLRDPRLLQGSRVILAMRGVTDGPLVDWWSHTMLTMDGADHTRLRRLVARAFTPPVVLALRPFFRATAERLAAGFAPDGTCEFMSAFAEEYPLEGICEMLGVPPERRAAFYGYASDLGLIFSMNVGRPAVRARAEAGLAGLYDCVDDAIAHRRAEPGDDLVSALIAAEAEGDRLTQDELRTMLVGLVFAGNDTTRNQLALGLIAFTEHPEMWSRLRANPLLAPLAVDEMMRVSPTIATLARIVSEDVVYHDVVFPKGTVLQLSIAAANIDGVVFGEGGFDITVERPSNLSFSGGMHRCLGLWLAKAEMEEALLVLSRRYERVVRNGTPQWQEGLGIDGPTTLPLRFTSAARG